MLNDQSDQIRGFTAQALEAISTVEARSALDLIDRMKSTHSNNKPKIFC